MVNNDFEQVFALIYFMMIVFAIVSLVFVLVLTVSNWRIFNKAGEPGWKAIVPIYNIYCMIKIAFGPGKEWLMIGIVLNVLGYMLGNVGFVLSLAGYAISSYIGFGFIKRFAGTNVAVASIFLPIIIYPIVAFSKKYTYTESNIIDINQ